MSIKRLIRDTIGLCICTSFIYLCVSASTVVRQQGQSEVKRGVDAVLIEYIRDAYPQWWIDSYGVDRAQRLSTRFVRRELTQRQKSEAYIKEFARFMRIYLSLIPSIKYAARIDGELFLNEVRDLAADESLELFKNWLDDDAKEGLRKIQEVYKNMSTSNPGLNDLMNQASTLRFLDIQQRVYPEQLSTLFNSMGIR